MGDFTGRGHRHFVVGGIGVPRTRPRRLIERRCSRHESKRESLAQPFGRDLGQLGALAFHPPANPIKQEWLGHTAVFLPSAAFGFTVDRDLGPGLFVLDDLWELHLAVLQVRLGFRRILCANCAARVTAIVLAVGRIRIIACVYRVRKLVGAERFELSTS